jgi:NADH:ubiquinone oxidoreductase subunit K
MYEVTIAALCFGAIGLAIIIAINRRNKREAVRQLILRRLKEVSA